MNVNFQKIISSCLLITFLNTTLVNAFAAIVPASHDEVLAFRADQEVDAEIRRTLPHCGGFHALALFKMAADVLSGHNAEAESKIKKYFKKDNIIEDLTSIVQAVRLGRGYKDGLRTDMNVPTYAMEGYRKNLNIIGGFINKDSELAILAHIHTTQKGANFTEHLRLTHQYLHRSSDVNHPRFVFSEAVIVVPVSIELAESVAPAPPQVKMVINLPAADSPATEARVVKVVAQPMELAKTRKYTASEYIAMEAELINKRREAYEERAKSWSVADQNAKKVRDLKEVLQASSDKICRLQRTLQALKDRLRQGYQLQEPQQIEKLNEEIKTEREKIKAKEAELREACKENILADRQKTVACEVFEKIEKELFELRAAAEEDRLTQIRNRVADLKLGDMPLDDARKALEFIDKCRAARPATYEVIPDSSEMIREVAGLLEKYSRDDSCYNVRQNIHEILSALFADNGMDEREITHGICRLDQLPKKLLGVQDLGKFFARMAKQLGLTDRHLLGLINALADIPAEFAPKIIRECLEKTFYYSGTPIDDRIDAAMYPIVTECLETTKEFEFREFFNTLNNWNMREQKAELLAFLQLSNNKSVRCEDALRWLNECSQEGGLASFVGYFKRRVESERATLKPLAPAQSGFLHQLAKTFYTHSDVHFTKEMALAMRSMSFDTYPSEAQFQAFRDVYLRLIGRVYYPEYTRSQSSQLLKRLYDTSKGFRNCERMRELLNRYEDLVLADVETLGTKAYRPIPSGLVPSLLVKSRAMVLDSLCQIGEQNEAVIRFANETLCQDFFDAEDLVNCGSVDSETIPFVRATYGPIGYGRASCNTWHRAQVMEAVARNVVKLGNLNRQKAIKLFIKDGDTGDKRSWILSAFCEVPDSVIDSPDFQSLCQRIAECGDRPKMMQSYSTYYNKKGNLGLYASVPLELDSRDLTDSQKAVVLRDLVDMADSADPSFRTEYFRSIHDDPRFKQDSDDKKIQLYAYLFYAAKYKHETAPVNHHTVSGKTSLIRPVSRIARTPSIIVSDEAGEEVYVEDPLDLGGQEIVDEYGRITYIPDPMYKARVDAQNSWIQKGRAQPIAVQ